MARSHPLARIVVASAGSRDALLLRALDLGATVAIWIDPDDGWVEAYARPRDGRYRWRGLTWPYAPPLVVDLTASRSATARADVRTS